MNANMDRLLHEALMCQASDVHITVGVPPTFRVNGTLVKTNYPILKPEDTEKLFYDIAGEERRYVLKQKGEVDFSYVIHGISRFRVNAFRQRGSTALVARLVAERVPSLEELRLPDVLGMLARKPRGLVLVTGPTGSGKSTTLAAMINLINQERYAHIITLEDPIEYLHKHNRAIINQREIHSDTESFSDALRASLREDPDVILVGEMRDAETIGTAITAAETGHMVFATLHTNDSSQTVDRIIDSFPPHQQQQVRVQLAMNIQGIVSQQLLPTMDGAGRIAALEILIATPAVRNLIREGKTHQIPSALQTGARFGMVSMDASLRELVRKRLISREEAMARAIDAENLYRLLGS